MAAPNAMGVEPAAIRKTSVAEEQAIQA